MGYSREELATYLRDKTSELEAQQVEKRNIQQAKVRSVQELVADPKWTFFVHLVEERRAMKESSRKACEVALCRGQILNENSYANIRLDLERNIAWEEALAWALGEIKQLTEQNEAV